MPGARRILGTPEAEAATPTEGSTVLATRWAPSAIVRLRAPGSSGYIAWKPNFAVHEELEFVLMIEVSENVTDLLFELYPS